MATAIVGIVLLLMFLLAVKSIIKSKAKGQCNCGCKSCSLNCNSKLPKH